MDDEEILRKLHPKVPYSQLSLQIKELMKEARASAIKEYVERTFKGNSTHLLGCEIEGIAGILDRRGEIEIAKKLCELAAKIK